MAVESTIADAEPDAEGATGGDRQERSGAGAAGSRVNCSFCAKPHEEVFCVIAGPGGVQICDRCVAACARIVAKRRAAFGNRR